MVRATLTGKQFAKQLNIASCIVLVRLHQFVQYIKNLGREDDSFFCVASNFTKPEDVVLEMIDEV